MTRPMAYIHFQTGADGPDEEEDAMLALKVGAMETEQARGYWNGGLDAMGRVPEKTVSYGGGNPCRHCLSDIEEGAPMLILSHKPFRSQQPYAECGPIFLHGQACERYPETSDLPPMFFERDAFLVRGYHANERIKYGSGRVTAVEDLAAFCGELLEDPEVAFVHIRSSRYNCFQCRVERV